MSQKNIILDKWKQQKGFFLKFVDGDKKNTAINNLEHLFGRDLRCAFREDFHKIEFDWDAYLTDDEKEYVLKNPNWRKQIKL